MARGIEQAAIVPVQDGESMLALEAVWLAPPAASREADAPTPLAVVAAPHPSYGGSLDNPVVTEIAHALRGCGAGTLRFNWRGVGASQGEVSADVEQAAADFTAALDHVVKTCLAKAPGDRWQTARDLLAELQAIAAGADDGFVTPASRPMTLLSPLMSRPRRRPPGGAGTSAS